MTHTQLTWMIGLMIVAVAALPAIGSAERTERHAYVGGTPVGLCRATTPGLSSACFLLDGSESVVSIQVVDIVGHVLDRPPPVQYAFDRIGGPSLADGTFCGSIEDLTIPPGALRLMVRVDLTLQHACSGALDAMPARAGEIVASFA